MCTEQSIIYEHDIACLIFKQLTPCLKYKYGTKLDFRWVLYF